MIVQNKPYKRIVLPGAETSYIGDIRFSNNLFEQKRVVQLLEEELKEIFKYIEPNVNNYNVYSLKIYELFMKASIEFENICKTILNDNKYSKNSDNLNIIDYKKLNTIMCLSKYSCTMVYMPRDIFRPFEDWDNQDGLNWYRDYNSVKHNRTSEFSKANLKNLILSISALVILMNAQYGNYSLDYSPRVMIKFSDDDGNLDENYDSNFMNHSIFDIKKPTIDQYNYKYNFNWDELKNTQDCVEKFDFDVV